MQLVKITDFFMTETKYCILTNCKEVEIYLEYNCKISKNKLKYSGILGSKLGLCHKEKNS